MKNIKTTLITEAIFSDDGRKRYLLKKTWDEAKPELAIIMLAPSEAAGIELDTTTQLVLNNAARLGYGAVAITNLFATLNDFSLQMAEDEDPENTTAMPPQTSAILSASSRTATLSSPSSKCTTSPFPAQRPAMVSNICRSRPTSRNFSAAT